MYHKKMSLPGMLCIMFFVYGAQEPIDTYHGMKITPESLLELGPKLDQETEKFFETWLYNHRHIVALLHNAVVHGELDERIIHRDQIQSFLEVCKLKNLSKFNFVIPVSCVINGVEKNTQSESQGL